MEEKLHQLLYAHLVQYHPDVLIELQGARKVSAYLEEKVNGIKDFWQSLDLQQVPPHIVVEQCMQRLTENLWPSRYQYLSEIVEEEFNHTSEHWRESGIRTYEVINLVTFCQPVFEEMGFTEELQENRALRYAVIGTIDAYLQSN